MLAYTATKARDMNSEDFAILAATPLFEALKKDDAVNLLGETRPKSLERHQILFQQGAVAEFFCLILDGWVRVFRTTSEGRETTLAVYSKGETFAEAALFMQGSYPASAETLTPSRILKIEGARLRHAIRNNPEIAFSMLASTSKHLRHMVEQVEQMKSLTAPQRLAAFFLKLCAANEERASVKLPFEKALIAHHLGMKPASLSRAIAALQEQGVRVHRDEVAIEDVRGLERFVRLERGD